MCDVLPPLAPHHAQLHSIPHPPSFLVFCELVEDKQSTNTIFERKSLLDLERMVWKYAMTCGNFGQVARLLVRNLGLDAQKLSKPGQDQKLHDLALIMRVCVSHATSYYVIYCNIVQSSSTSLLARKCCLGTQAYKLLIYPLNQFLTVAAKYLYTILHTVKIC